MSHTGSHWCRGLRLLAEPPTQAAHRPKPIPAPGSNNSCHQLQIHELRACTETSIGQASHSSLLPAVWQMLPTIHFAQGAVTLQLRLDPPWQALRMHRAQNVPNVIRDSPQHWQLVPEGPSVTYLGVNNGVRIVQPDVVIDEDVVNTRIIRVNPQGLPSPRREPISGPPERARSTQRREWVTALGCRQARLRCRLRASSEPGHGMETALSLCPLWPPGRHFTVR